MSAQRGQTLVLFALLLPMVLLPVGAYAAETSVLAAHQARLAEVAAVGALDAAQQLDEARLRSGAGLAVDPNAAAAVIASDVASQSPQAAVESVRVSGSAVTLTLNEQVPLRLFPFARARGVTLRASASASLVPGYGAPR